MLRKIKGRLRTTAVALEDTIRFSMPGAASQSRLDTVCIFASYEPNGHIAPHVAYYLRALRGAGLDIIFIQASDSEPSHACYQEILPFCRTIINRRNIGHDFVSWKLGLKAVAELEKYQKLLITNDSIIGPWTPLEPLLSTMASDPSALWGLTDCSETGVRHVQSYFLFCQRPVFTNPFFTRFWDSVTTLTSKWKIVLAYEIGLSRAAQTAGIPLRAVFPYEQVRQKCADLGSDFQFSDRILTQPLNPTLYAWDVLIRDLRYPFLKAELLRINRLGLKNLESWSDVVAHAPPELIAAAAQYEDAHRWLIPDRSRHSLPAPEVWGPFRRHASSVYAQLNHRYDQVRRFVCDIRNGDTQEMIRKLRKSRKLNWFVTRLSRRTSGISNPDLARQRYFAEARSALSRFLTSTLSLQLPPHTNPQVTIILVLFNKAELTYRCLESLSTLTNEAPFHVLIVDNASSDETTQLLGRVRGATVVRNDQNVGFLRACNQAADLTTTPHILFLNNDTILYPNSINIALDNLKNSKVGAVGGRIVLPNNELQEAGSIFWNDGTCAGYGRGLPLEADECMHRRVVDYCSGVFLMTPTKLFQELGGFDLRFAPAYYEEADYCAQLQSRGLVVIYDPRILVQHVEFGSSERSSAAFALMNTNREKFLQKNLSLLITKHPPNSPQYKARSVATGRRRWLFLDDRVALSHLGAGYPRMNAIIRHLADITSYDITIACTESFAGDWEIIRRDIPIDIEVLDLTAAHRREHFLRERLEQFDVVWVSRPSNMRHVLASSALKPRNERNFVVVYDAEAIFADRSLSEAQVFGLPTDQAQRDLEIELRNGSHADIVIAVCESDASRWRAATTRPVEIIGLDAPVSPGPKNFNDRKDILFAGSLHDVLSPNGDSLFWFMGQVMPLINKELPEVRVKAVGYTNDSVKHQIGRRSKIFSLVGQVPELRPYIIEHRIMIAPTRFAAGIPQKVFDAAVCGTPTVCSPLIASQMTWRDGEETLVGSIDDPQHFATQCIRLYTDSELWGRVYEKSLSSMREYSSQYELRSSLAKVLSTIDSLVAAERDGDTSLHGTHSNQNAA